MGLFSFQEGLPMPGKVVAISSVRSVRLFLRGAFGAFFLVCSAAIARGSGKGSAA
jgi:hypothetical protein